MRSGTCPSRKKGRSQGGYDTATLTPAVQRVATGTQLAVELAGLCVGVHAHSSAAALEGAIRNVVDMASPPAMPIPPNQPAAGLLLWSYPAFKRPEYSASPEPCCSCRSLPAVAGLLVKRTAWPVRGQVPQVSAEAGRAAPLEAVPGGAAGATCL